jgi:hypothetical protein
MREEAATPAMTMGCARTLNVCDDEVSVMSLKRGFSRVRVTLCVLGVDAASPSFRAPATVGTGSSNSSWTWQVSFW